MKDKAFYAGLATYAVALVVAFVGALIITGCGVPENANFSGRSLVSESADYYAETQFAELQDCTGIYEGSLAEVTLVFTEPAFPCQFYDGFCGGLFSAADMTIKIGGWHLFKHEALH